MWTLQICRSILDQAGNLAGIGKSTSLVLGPDERAIDDNVENAFSFREELYIGSQVFLQLGSQTDRLGFIVSLCAVVYFNFHC